jgi:hypothetical protein
MLGQFSSSARSTHDRTDCSAKVRLSTITDIPPNFVVILLRASNDLNPAACGGLER